VVPGHFAPPPAPNQERPGSAPAGRTVTAWLAVAAFGFLLAQSALDAGPLDASIPLLVVANPLTSA